MNRFPIEKAIKEEMGADTKVVHKVGVPFTVQVDGAQRVSRPLLTRCVGSLTHVIARAVGSQSEIDGKKGKLECLPLYYNNVLAPCGIHCCPGAIRTTALNAKAIKLGDGGAPGSDEMER